MHLVYDLTMRATRTVVDLAVRGDGKLGRGVAGRRAAIARLEAWAAAYRRVERPLVWLHAPSVGETLMAGSILEVLRDVRPDCQIAFTFFSPSAERASTQVRADVASYLPWDIRGDVCRALDALRPAVVAFVRTEVWPALIDEAARRGARCALVNAPLAADSSRLRPIARRMLRPTYRALDAVGAVRQEDARRFAELGVPASRVHVTGDARFDQVMTRTKSDPDGARVPGPLRTAPLPVVVAGSIWEADADRILPAIAALRTRRLLWVLAPHEPTPAHVVSLEQGLARHGIRHARVDRLEAATREQDFPDAVVVDRTGLLADLYSVARVAYVGGGFGWAGLHAVIEPAAHGVPVLFGPRHGNTVEANDLVAAGGGFVVRDAAGLIDRVSALLDDTRAGEAARMFVAARLGGSAANAALIVKLLGDP